jgi:hypothetical protein
MPWDEDHLIEVIGHRVAEEAARYATPRSLDTLSELQLQDLTSEALTCHGGIAVIAQPRYPDAALCRKRSEGRRGDLLLVPDENDGPDGAGYWIEIKRVAQFLESGPNRWYEQAWLRTIPADLLKLARDSVICHAGLLLFVFARNRGSGIKDVQRWHEWALGAGYPIGVPRMADFPLDDRLGNSHGVVALCPLRRL